MKYKGSYEGCKCHIPTHTKLYNNYPKNLQIQYKIITKKNCYYKNLPV